MDDLTTQRIATFEQVAIDYLAFADRQEARFPGRMDHIVLPAKAAADLARAVAAAYRSGDKTTAREARKALAEHELRHSLQGIA